MPVSRMIVPEVPLYPATFRLPELPGPLTLPLPVGVAHVASPRQKVELLAPEPEFKLLTGRLPVTPPLPLLARLMGPTRADARVPLVIFEAFVVSVVAEGAKGTPPVLCTVRAEFPAEFVTSCVKTGIAAVGSVDWRLSVPAVS